MPIGTKTGIVKSYVPEKGYGFIGPDEGGPDVFVHASAVQDAGLNYVAEQYVSFDLASINGPGSSRLSICDCCSLIIS